MYLNVLNPLLMNILFSWAPKSVWTVTAAMKLKDTCSMEGKLRQTRQYINKQRHHFADKFLYSQSCGFSSSHVWMWELVHKEGWATKNWCFWIMVLEKTFKIPWAARKLNQSSLKDINPEYSLEGLIMKLSSNILATWCKELTHWKRPWCWER